MNKTLITATLDVIRFEIIKVKLEETSSEQAVEIYVNDVEMTSKGAGLGMTPQSLLVPQNKLIPSKGSTQTFRVPVARCGGCGFYGCGVTDAQITFENDFVIWKWLVETPTDQVHTFAREQYEEGVKRLEKNYFSNEADSAKTARLIQESYLSISQLQKLNIAFNWAENKHNHPDVFEVSLSLNADSANAENLYYISLYFPWDGRTPESLASHIIDKLSDDPKIWHATWYASVPANKRKPHIAGAKWRHSSLVRGVVGDSNSNVLTKIINKISKKN